MVRETALLNFELESFQILPDNSPNDLIGIFSPCFVAIIEAKKKTGATCLVRCQSSIVNHNLVGFFHSNASTANVGSK